MKECALQHIFLVFQYNFKTRFSLVLLHCFFYMLTACSAAHNCVARKHYIIKIGNGFNKILEEVRN